MVNGLEKLLRVTSDSRIWPSGGKIVQCISCGVVQNVFDQAFVDDLDKIYSEYDLYFQGSGREQKVFIDGIGRPRSELLLEYFFDTIHGTDLYANPACLDFGCGKGNFLRAMSKNHSKWKLFGADLSEKNREYIEDIKGVEGYFSGGIDAVNGVYDLLSLSHVLEHIFQPLAFLKSIHSHLKPNGYLLIAVPNWRKNPFDLLVADHCLHFSSDRLVGLLQAAGFEILSSSEEIIPKELVLIARPEGMARNHAPELSPAIVDKDWASLMQSIDWLSAMVAWAKTESSPKVGLLGTALAATWLDASCQSRFGFFVDEDTDRAGYSYMGRPVFLPNQLSPATQVLVPLPALISTNVCKHLNRPGSALFVSMG